MFAGKTEELIRRVNRLKYAGQTYAAFKPVVDNRYSKTEIVTHNGIKIPAKAVKNAGEILYAVKNGCDVNVIVIDEAQFFRSDLVEVAIELSKNRRVIIAGLDTDFRGRPFGPIGDLLAVADEDVHLKAVCIVCGRPATRTQRLTNGKPSRQDEPIILIGSDNVYQARCRACHVVF